MLHREHNLWCMMYEKNVLYFSDCRRSFPMQWVRREDVDFEWKRMKMRHSNRIHLVGCRMICIQVKQTNNVYKIKFIAFCSFDFTSSPPSSSVCSFLWIRNFSTIYFLDAFCLQSIAFHSHFLHFASFDLSYSIKSIRYFILGITIFIFFLSLSSTFFFYFFLYNFFQQTVDKDINGGAFALSYNYYYYYFFLHFFPMKVNTAFNSEKKKWKLNEHAK